MVQTLRFPPFLMSKITVYQRGSDIKVLGGIIGSDVWASVQLELLSDILMNIELFSYGINPSLVREKLLFMAEKVQISLLADEEF